MQSIIAFLSSMIFWKKALASSLVLIFFFIVISFFIGCKYTIFLISKHCSIIFFNSPFTSCGTHNFTLRTITKISVNIGVDLISVYKAHAAITDYAVRDDRTIILEDDKPMIFGKEKNKGLRFNGRCLEVVTIGENGITMDDIMIHHEDTGIHMMLARMSGDLPVTIGVIRNVKKTSYTQLYEDQMEEQMANGKYKCVDDLLNSGDTWEI